MEDLGQAGDQLEEYTGAESQLLDDDDDDDEVFLFFFLF